MIELNFGSFFRPYKAEGVSRLLFLEPQAPVITQVSFVCCSEHFFHNAEVDTEKMVFFRVPHCVQFDVSPKEETFQSKR